MLSSETKRTARERSWLTLEKSQDAKLGKNVPFQAEVGLAEEQKAALMQWRSTERLPVGAARSANLLSLRLAA